MSNFIISILDRIQDDAHDEIKIKYNYLDTDEVI